MALRHRSRHLRATIYNKVKTDLATLGWVHAPINFDTRPVTVIDYQPDERQEPVKTNTVAVSLGDVINDVDEELGAADGGLRSAFYPVFLDVYMGEQALSDAICDDLRDTFDSAIFALINQVDGSDSGEQIEIEQCIGPDRPTGLNAADPFKRYWRVMRLGVRLYYQSGSSTPQRSVTLDGGGAVAGTARAARRGVPSLSGGGALAAAGAGTGSSPRTGTFTLAGGGSLAGVAATGRRAATTLSGGGSPADVAVARRRGSLAIAGGGDATAAGTVTPRYVRVTTTGASFNPTVELVSGSTATVNWVVEETLATATGINPTISFGSTGTRHVRMNVTNGAADAMSDVVTFNLGFSNADDTGPYAIGAGYNKTPQAVSAVANVNVMTGLLRFCAANISTLTGAIDFSGMSALQFVECFNSRLTGVNLTGCNSLIRLNVEQNAVPTLDLNPVASTLKDLRAAAQNTASLTFTTLTANLPQQFHFCVRDQVVLNMPDPGTKMPTLQQLWIWNSRQSGTLSLPTTIHDLRAFSNSYTAANFTGCTNISYADLSHNNFGPSGVDFILTTINGLNVSNSFLDLTGDGAPSATGESAKSSLVARGWTVRTDVLLTIVSGGGTPVATGLAGRRSAVAVSGGGALTGGGVGSGPRGGTFTLSGGGSLAGGRGVHSDDFERADAVGLANVGKAWYSPGSATANIVSGDLVRTDSGSYQVLINPGGEDLPADYTVTASIPAATIGSFFGIVGRWNGTQGVTAFFDAGSNFANLTIADAASYAQNKVTVTADNAFPASWSSGTGDHTFSMTMTGSLIQVYLDGTLVAHATKTTNSTATGTGYGISGDGGSRHWHSIGAMVGAGTISFTLTGGGALVATGATARRGILAVSGGGTPVASGSGGGLAPRNGTFLLDGGGALAGSARSARRGTLAITGGGGLTAGLGVHSDDFERANAVGLANVGNAWYSPGSATANITSGDLVRTDSGSYQLVVNPGGQDLPADYTVTTTIPAATVTSFVGLVGRWDGTEGVRVLFGSSPTVAQLSIGNASTFSGGNVPVTADNAMPTSWSSGTGDHTFAVQFVGTTVNVLCDGVLVAHGAITTNSTATGTGYGICGDGGPNRAFHSIGTFSGNIVALPGGGTLTAAGSGARRGTTSVTGGGPMTAAATTGRRGAIAVSGGGTPAASGAASTPRTGTLTLSGGGGGTATGLARRGGTIAATGGGALAYTRGVHSDDFNRANATGVANLGNAWYALSGATANIVSNDVVRTDSGGYRLLLNPGGGDLPADYTVTATIPAASIGSFMGIVGRWNGSQGVTAFFDSGAAFANLTIADAASYALNKVTVTADNAFPATWSSSSTGDHTFAMTMSGSTIQIYLDGTLVAHGTKTTNSTLTGTGYGISGEGQNRAWHDIGTTVP